MDWGEEHKLVGPPQNPSFVSSSVHCHGGCIHSFCSLASHKYLHADYKPETGLCAAERKKGKLNSPCPHEEFTFECQ